MEHARHVFRVALVLVVVLAAVFLARGFLVPQSFGLYGPYRYGNVIEQMNVRKPAYAGAVGCGDCHADRLKKLLAGSHKTVNCEVCHAPLAFHVKENGEVVAAPVDRSFTLCARCHRKILGRPERFPQVVLEQHVNGPPEGEICIQCHDPHSPKP